MNSKLSGRFGFVRASMSSGFRAPTPGQQNGFNIATIFDPALGDLVNNGTIPSISPVAALRGGEPLAPEKSINYTAGVVFDSGQFSLTADYFRINVFDRIGITSNFTLTDTEIEGLLAEGVEAARDLRRFRFFTNAFSTASQGIDLVSTFTPLALRGNTTISAVFNYTDTEVTDNRKGLLNDRRLTEFAYALPRTRWNVGLTQQVGRVSVLGRVNWFGGWYDFDSGFAQLYAPSGGIEQGFFDGRPILDLEASIALGGGVTLAVGAQNALNTYPDESARAMSVGEKYSEYTPWGFNGAYYYVRIGYGWGN
ncbi:MAG: TonB-dependent receptor [Acidobacteria bacterium]|nr:TonB-dependent receptor [Acidobacteriota bacterium]